MSYPDKITLGYSYTGFAQGLGDGSFPGAQLDADLAEVKADTNALNDFVRAVVRSDRKLQNGLVGAEALGSDAKALFNSGFVARGNWATATEYAVGDVVNTLSNARAYVCLVAHTSSGLFDTDLAAARWVLWAVTSGAASGIPNVPAGNISATDVQSAVNELDSEKQAVSTNLTAISGLSPIADRVPYYTGTTSAALAAFTTFGRSLVDDADAAAGRTTLGLGSFATLSALPDNSVTSPKYQDGSVTTAKIADGGVTGAKLAVGAQVQQVQTLATAVATGTTTIPYDNTVPQSTEGTEFMTAAITPQSASNILVIDVIAHVAASAAVDLTAALFQDSGANAIAAAPSNVASSGVTRTLHFRHRMTAGTTSATTFRVRIGPGSAATVTFNGVDGVGLFGGVCTSSITITEVKG